MGRLLYESFVFYASTDCKIRILYHGMSQQLSFSTLFCSFNAPTSTTSAESVACSFGGGNGIILKFESSESCKYIRTIDMCLFSCYDIEEEHLIFETRLHIKDIAIPRDIGYIGDDFMRVLSLYDLLVHGGTVHNKRLLKSKYQKRLCKLLRRVMNNDLSNYPTYVQTLILSLTSQKQKIWLNVQQILELDEDLKNIFLAENGMNFGEFLCYLKDCGAVICPISKTKWDINDHTFELITRNEKHDNVIVSGLNVICKLSNNKQIIFRPQLTKVLDTYDVKMELLNTYNKLPITVHFNVECKELDNYYTSSHPRYMDTKHYKNYDITLPSIDETIKSI
eukprot:400386_1